MPTVVIADDSPTMRRIVSSVLGKEGFDVVEAVDGLSAVQAVFRSQPDALVIDVQMPRLSGYVAVRILKEDWATADIPVILLTSLDAASDRYWGGQSGADKFLTKSFEAHELANAVREVIEVGDAKRGGSRDSLRPDPVELTDDDVLEKTCDVLDRTLFEASIAGEVTAIAANVNGFEATVAAVLGVLARVVDHHLAGVILVDERAGYLSVGREVARSHYSTFLVRAAEALALQGDVPIEASELSARVADPQGLLQADEDGDELKTFLSMPLRGHGGHVMGVLALSSGFDEAFGDAALSTLQLLAGPAALVIDNARLADRRGAPA